MPCTPGVSGISPARTRDLASMTSTRVPWAMNSRWPPLSKAISSQPPSPGSCSVCAMWYWGLACAAAQHRSPAAPAAANPALSLWGIICKSSQVACAAATLSVEQPCAQVQECAGKDTERDHRCGVEPECRAPPPRPRRRWRRGGHRLVEVHEDDDAQVVEGAHHRHGRRDDHEPQVVRLPACLEDAQLRPAA